MMFSSVITEIQSRLAHHSSSLQVETLTVTGAASASGNLTVTITSAEVYGSPLVIPVAVVNGDSAATVAGKIRTALAIAALTALYTVGGSSTAVTLTRIQPGPNDATLLMSLAGGATGVPTVTSANTTSARILDGWTYREDPEAETQGQDQLPCVTVFVPGFTETYKPGGRVSGGGEVNAGATIRLQVASRRSEGLANHVHDIESLLDALETDITDRVNLLLGSSAAPFSASVDRSSVTDGAFVSEISLTLTTKFVTRGSRRT